jgi:ATP-dependent DNA helicase RecG
VPPPLDLSSDVTYLKGVGPRLAETLGRLGIRSVRDLLFYLPRDHEDRREVRALGEAREGEKATFRLRVIDQSEFRYRGRNHPRIKVADDSGIALLYCFNRGFLKSILTPGSRVVLTGAYALRRGVRIFSQFDVTSEKEAPEPGIVPVYRLTEGLSQRVLRRTIRGALERFGSAVEDDIPRFIIEGYRLGPKGELLREIHFPGDPVSLRAAREALSYEEFLKFQIAAALARDRNARIFKRRTPSSGALKTRFLERLGFPLTSAQERVLGEIEEDTRNARPMNRLLQGDVGCGKTVVALAAALHSIESGGQVALMAPTEILARQHAQTASALLEPLGVKTDFLSGSVRGEERRVLLGRLERGEVSFLAGTHALYSEDVRYKNLTLAIIDEQQKFGVLQRGSLRAKGDHPDCVVMSATPIPRTLSMTLYGDLDVSIIDEMPKGRAGVETEVVKQAELEKVYRKVREEAGKGRQAYFIYPVIEESLAADMKNAVESHVRLKTSVFPELGVGLLHGRMDDEEKNRVMRDFKERRLHVLVSTSVVEVGVDVPNATVMVIEQAERFGLSNLHQLRGRIGRGEHGSVCYLVPDRSTGREAFDRLSILRETNDGFKIAECDLKLRGPGELLGTHQSGTPSFIIEDFEVNSKLIYRAQRDARALVDGTIGTEAERKAYLDAFVKGDAYRTALFYFGG